MPDHASVYGYLSDEVSDVADLLDLVTARPAWQADAACREHPEITWFPVLGQTAEAARKVCAGCLVRDDCRNFALDLGAEAIGVWGGTVPGERRQMRRVAS